MNRRLLISIANLVAIGAAFYILFEYPQYSNDAFYLLIIWMIVGFVLLYATRPSLPPARTGSPSDPHASPFPSNPSASAPLPSGNAQPAPSIGFCIYCATPIPPGTRACPTCGHALPRW